MLDLNERGMTSARIDEIFNELKAVRDPAIISLSLSLSLSVSLFITHHIPPSLGFGSLDCQGGCQAQARQLLAAGQVRHRDAEEAQC